MRDINVVEDEIEIECLVSTNQSDFLVFSVIISDRDVTSKQKHHQK